MLFGAEHFVMRKPGPEPASFEARRGPHCWEEGEISGCYVTNGVLLGRGSCLHPLGGRGRGLREDCRGKQRWGPGPGTVHLQAAQTSGLLSWPDRATSSWSRNGQTQAVREEAAHTHPSCRIGMTSIGCALAGICKARG